MDASIVLRGMYEISYGIATLNGPNAGPFAKVAANPTENILVNNRFEKSLRRFIECDVMAQTGMSFEKAIELPCYQFAQLCETSLKVAEEKAKRITATANAIQNELDGKK